MTTGERPIETWLIDLDRHAAALEALDASVALLPPDVDRSQVAAVVSPTVVVQRRRHRAARIALRTLLARIVGRRAASQPFVLVAGGKPKLAAGEVQFSLSHAEGFALVALSLSGPVGVDLELARSVRIATERRAAIVAAGQAIVAAAVDNAGDLDDGAFLRSWVRLEALAKATGEGMGHLLGRIGYEPNTAPPTPTALKAIRGMHAIVDLDVGAGRYGAVAAHDAAIQALPRGTRGLMPAELAPALLEPSQWPA